MLTVNEAAALLGVAPRTVRMMMERGWLCDLSGETVEAMRGERCRQALLACWAEGQARVGRLIGEFTAAHHKGG